MTFSLSLDYFWTSGLLLDYYFWIFKLQMGPVGFEIRSYCALFKSQKWFESNHSAWATHAHHFSWNIQILLWNSNFVQSSWRIRKLCLWGWQPPPHLTGQRFVSYSLGNIRLVQKGWSYILLRGLIGLVIRSSSTLFKSQSDQCVPNPLTRRVFPKWFQ